MGATTASMADLLLEQAEQAETPVLLKVEEVAKRLRVSKGTVYALIRADMLPGVISLGPQTTRIHRATFEEWIEARAHGR